MLEVLLPLAMNYYVKSQSTDEQMNDTLTPIELGLSFYISIAIYLAIAFWAASLSWSCNTSRGIKGWGRFVYSLFAFFFGSIYLFFYWIFTYGYCGPTVVKT
jgi:hypothetical protein